MKIRNITYPVKVIIAVANDDIVHILVKQLLGVLPMQSIGKFNTNTELNDWQNEF